MLRVSPCGEVSETCPSASCLAIDTSLFWREGRQRDPKTGRPESPQERSQHLPVFRVSGKFLEREQF